VEVYVSDVSGRALYTVLSLKDRDSGGCTKALVWKAQSANTLTEVFIVVNGLTEGWVEIVVS